MPAPAGDNQKRRIWNMLYNNYKQGIFILHENPEWIVPFAEAFEKAGVAFNEILLTQGSIDLDSPPPQGVFWSFGVGSLLQATQEAIYILKIMGVRF